jgi:hypothetical protein
MKLRLRTDADEPFECYHQPQRDRVDETKWEPARVRSRRDFGI